MRMTRLSCLCTSSLVSALLGGYIGCVPGTGVGRQMSTIDDVAWQLLIDVLPH